MLPWQTAPLWKRAGNFSQDEHDDKSKEVFERKTA